MLTYNPKRSSIKKQPTSTAELRIDLAYLSSDPKYSNALPLRLRAAYVPPALHPTDEFNRPSIHKNTQPENTRVQPPQEVSANIELKDNASLVQDSLPPTSQPLTIQSLLSSVILPCSDVEMLDAVKWPPDSLSKDHDDGEKEEQEEMDWPELGRNQHIYASGRQARTPMKLFGRKTSSNTTIVFIVGPWLFQCAPRSDC
jgi:hypothetical protein